MRLPSNFLFVLALTLSSLATSAAIDGNNMSNTTERCGFDGDSDTYGLGIRIGFYFQLLATRLATCFTIEMAILMRTLNDGFQFSTFAGLLYVTLTDGKSSNSGQLNAIEMFIMLLLCINGVGVPSTCRTSALREIPRILCVAAIISYGTWFFYSGMDRMAHPPCSHEVFFFANVDLYGWYRTLWKVIITISAVLMGFNLIFLTYWYSRQCLIIGWTQKYMMVDEDLGNWKRLFTSLLSLIFFTLSIELTIKMSNIQGVNELGSTGQLLPLILGVSSFVMVLFKCIMQ